MREESLRKGPRKWSEHQGKVILNRGPSTEKARFCLVEVWARGRKREHNYNTLHWNWWVHYVYCHVKFFDLIILVTICSWLFFKNLIWVLHVRLIKLPTKHHLQVSCWQLGFVSCTFPFAHIVICISVNQV